MSMIKLGVDSPSGNELVRRDMTCAPMISSSSLEESFDGPA